MDFRGFSIDLQLLRQKNREASEEQRLWMWDARIPKNAVEAEGQSNTFWAPLRLSENSAWGS